MDTLHNTKGGEAQVEQEQSPLSQSAESGKKKRTGVGINVLTVLLLVFLPPVGLIVMWLATTWGKVVKVVITLIFLLVIIVKISLVFLALGGTTSPDTSQKGEAPSRTMFMGSKARSNDTHRINDMKIYATAQKIRHSEEGRYLTSVGMPTKEQWGRYMGALMTDPGEREYTWVDNTMDDQKFCIYASLERGVWYAVSPKGYYACNDAKPTLEDCCVTTAIENFSLY